jgi:hypothetical protein
MARAMPHIHLVPARAAPMQDAEPLVVVAPEPTLPKL